MNMPPIKSNSQLNQSQQIQVNQESHVQPGPEYDDVIRQAWYQIKERKRNEDINRLTDEVREKDKEIQKLRIDLAALKAFSDDVHNQLRNKTENNKAFDDLNAMYLDLRRQSNQQNINKDETISNLKGEIVRLNEVINQHKQREYEIEKYKRGIALVSETEKNYTRMLKERDAEIELLNKKLVKGDDAQYDEFVLRIQKMDKHIEYLQNIIVQKDQQIIQSKHQVQEVIDKTYGDSSKQELRIQQQSKTNFDNVLREKISQFDRDLAKKDEEIFRLNNIRIQNEQKLTMIENHRTTMTNITTNANEALEWEKKYNAIKKENDELQSLKIHFTEEIQNIRRQDQARYEQQIEQLQNQISIQGQQVNQQSRDIEGLYSEITVKDQKILQLSTEIQSLRQLDTNIRNRDAEIEGLRATVQVLKKENEKLYPSVANKNYTTDVQNVLSQQEIQIQNRNSYNAANVNPNQRMSVHSNGSFLGNNNAFNNNPNQYNGSTNQTAYFRGSLQPNYLQVPAQNSNQMRNTSQY